ncbi:AAA family ATPase [Streptomyces sp. NBC_00878]|uniref:AAA family ATPase n=1 Tax=Streptomyces sp. NBC_00878 TaxID=2975854 RepID=UPI0022501D48|nr:LuxR family transcriptional regulator [Streptomyces sp. NBC_00878]MCX4908973.1 AAA family ATPase [Streptomyces sp. NBC_00878]
MDLYGRQREKAALDQILAGAREGTGAALVLWGDPGIGKTTLLDHAVEAAAADFTVLTCRGTRLESGLAFAALHELLWPVMDRIADLPQPQASALRGALGHSDDPADRFLIGAAVLTLVCDLTEKQPVLIVADDAQWLDEPTARCLAFVARRLRTEHVAALLTAHEDPACGTWERLPAMEIRGLADEDAQLLASAAAPDVSEALIRRTVRAAAGNPLALRELPPALLAADASAHALPGEQISVGPRLRHAFNVGIAGLAAPTRALLLLAAAEDRGDQQVLRQAGGVLGVDAAAWDDALRSGLLSVRGDRVRFRHPLIRAVVYEDAPFSERKAAHLALARALTGKDAEELRAWHLAAAAEEADESVARLLEHSADRAWTRGGCATAARALRRAAELSPAVADAARRLARGALAAWEAGEVDVARELLLRAERLTCESTVTELSGGLRGLIEFAHGDQEQAYRYLARDMRVVSDPRKAIELGSMAVRAGWSAGRPDLQAEALRQLGTPAPADHFPEADLLPLLYEWWTEGAATGAVLTPATAGSADDVLTRLGSGSWRLAPPTPLCVAWGMERSLSDALRRKIVELRRTDSVTALAVVLAQTVTLDLARGNWAEAAANAAEGLRLTEEIGADHPSSQCRNCLGWLAAARGDEETVATAAARTLELSVPRGVRALSAAAHWNLGMSALFAGRAGEALEQLVRLTEPGHDAAHPTFAVLAAMDTIEAAVHAGQPEAIEPQARLLHDWARRTDAAWAVSAVHLTRALLASGPEAEDSFRLALAVPGATSRPFAHARTRLLYGEWLRRARRRTDARVQLAEAAETFRRLKATPLLERALTEQELTGQQLRRPGPAQDTRHILTSQELRVARLAGEGLTNREIAAQLLISPRTVGHHLSNVFPKLGIVSRAELSRVDFEGGLRLTG